MNFVRREQLVIIISRANLDVRLIPPLQIILPSLLLISPVSLYTSMKHQIKGDNLYEALVNNLQNQEGITSLTETLRQILDDKANHSNFRVCIIGGEHIDWDIILEFKRKNILIDTAGSHPRLSQISYTTGGISKDITESTMIKSFLTIFGMSKQLRKYYLIEQNKNLNFTLQCKCCEPSKEVHQQFFTCSVCLCVYCCKKINKCLSCDTLFD